MTLLQNCQIEFLLDFFLEINFEFLQEFYLRFLEEPHQGFSSFHWEGEKFFEDLLTNLKIIFCPTGPMPES